MKNLKSVMRGNALFVVAMFLCFFWLMVFPVKTSMLQAQDVLVGIQHWSFFPNSEGQRVSGPGHHMALSGMVGLNKRLEIDMGVIGMLTPATADSVFGFVSFGYSLLDERWMGEKIAPNWVNMLFEAGVMGGIKGVYALVGKSMPGAAAQSEVVAQAFIKLTPLVLGNSFYRRRDRLPGLGLSYDIFSGRVSFFLTSFSLETRIWPK